MSVKIPCQIAYKHRFVSNLKSDNHKYIYIMLSKLTSTTALVLTATTVDAHLSEADYVIDREIAKLER